MFLPLLVDHSTVMNKHMVHDAVLVEQYFQHHLPFELTEFLW
jgi:hypothetical protein